MGDKARNRPSCRVCSFDQIPQAPDGRIEERWDEYSPGGSLMLNLARFPVCAICTRPLQLETCKVDELGKAVHEGCYLLKISLKLARGQPKPREEVAAITTGNPLRRAIVDFLDSASTRSAPIFCRDCGSAVEYRKSTFSYGAQTWEVPLPICRQCHPISRTPVCDA
jgi:hypothetical protein